MTQLQGYERLNFGQLNVSCKYCSLSKICVPLGLDGEDVEKLDPIVQKPTPLHAGDHVFHAAEPFEALFAVRSGCFKTYAVDEFGRKQVLGFHLPGEVIGLDAIYSGNHMSSAVALKTSRVCRLPYAKLIDLAGGIEGLNKHLYRLLSKEITNFGILARGRSAEKRVAAFLLSFSSRLPLVGYSATRFVLPMLRHDIGNHLRLSPETVSRVLNRFEKNRLIRLVRREIEILDMVRLKNIAWHTASSHQLALKEYASG